MRLGALVTTTRSDRPRLPRRRLLPEPGEAATRATPDEIPQPTRLKSDPMSFVLCPYNAQASAAAAKDRTSRRRLQAVLDRALEWRITY